MVCLTQIPTIKVIITVLAFKKGLASSIVEFRVFRTVG
jgi:hypothetical protein